MLFILFYLHTRVESPVNSGFYIDNLPNPEIQRDMIDYDMIRD